MAAKRVILSKKQWEEFLNGKTDTLKAYKETDLHHEFGDCPEEHIVEVEITEVSETIEISDGGVPFDP